MRAALFACGRAVVAPRSLARAASRSHAIVGRPRVVHARAMSGGAQRARDGDAVKIHYVGTLEDGSQFDSSRDRGEPIAFTVGSGQMIKGFDNGVRDMAVGDRKTIECAPAEAYGEIRPENILRVPKGDVVDAVGEDYIKVGEKLMVGQGMPATIVEVTDSEVALDANHPLAGKTLNFDIELMSLD
ncbi:hypothetical protein BE221DRAFT_73235, partial [Ostreococcus tauri]